MAINPVLVPFATSNSTTLYADISPGVMGGYCGTVSVVLTANLTILPRAPGMVPAAPELGGYTPLTETSVVVYGAGSTIPFMAPQAAAIVAAGAGTIVSYN